ncbi:hypothetical protein TI39_contig498g00009 [Zymoseptoria brevis]|uniref:Uncharacterized protein n=1 Tax=Zymoseptoria brevis TaxID=1047168 RepID=A0A0F4GIX7_9PEZI|nr:hypothetical protein TI39_contig498g00009 [Zymoseptoria brevis]
MLSKFAPNQLPVTVLMVRDAWCKTVMGPDMRGLEEALEMLVQEAKKGGELSDWNRMQWRSVMSAVCVGLASTWTKAAHAGARIP